MCGISLLGSLSAVIYRLGLDPDALAAAGASENEIESAMQSFGAAVDIARETGIGAFVSQGAPAYSAAVAAACFVGGVALVLAAVAVWRLVPKGLSITEEADA